MPVKRLVLLVLFLALPAAALPQETVTVRPEEIGDVLVNPGIGFMTFQRFNGDKLNEGTKWTEGYPIEYQKFDGDLKNENHPDTSLAYFRIYWRFIEPQRDQYRWDLLDRALETAAARGQTLLLRIAPYGTGADNDVPDWYRALVGPAMWRDVFKPHYLRLTGAAHECGMKVFMHSCGYNWALIDDLVDSGIDCFQFDQPAAYDMPRLAEKFKERKVALYSPLDIQKILPTGRKDFIVTEARRMVDIFRGFLIVKDYPDLKAIGVRPEWDQLAYTTFLEASGLKP